MSFCFLIFDISFPIEKKGFKMCYYAEKNKKILPDFEL
jgi:hypothetical protein